MNDEKFNDFLARNSIVWQFNLSRAPWRGGQFERLVGLVKRALQKSIGRGLLAWKELEEVLLDVEVTLNGRPLRYVEDDHQLPTLTPNGLLYTQTNVIPELDLHHVEDTDLRKRAKYLQRCKQVMWNRWTSEYVRALRERHNLIVGRDGVLRAAKLRNGRGILERAVQHLYPLELTCDRNNDAHQVQRGTQLNPNVQAFRPRRDAAVAARLRIQDDDNVED
ncbi:hypothetical protein QZH41_000579 [Actinostola sp. cb2023]|nr:hypothetical protein QZH41_000579 [Actinostola sp. cb2023]